MVVKIYISGVSGLKEVKKRQQRVMMILESKHIPYETIDISEPGRESDKEFMHDNTPPQPDDKFPLTPQIFRDEHYCGDYDMFDQANEIDELEPFLGVEKYKKLQNGRPGSEPSEEHEEILPNDAAESQPIKETTASEQNDTAETPAAESNDTAEPLSPGNEEIKQDDSTGVLPEEATQQADSQETPVEEADSQQRPVEQTDSQETPVEAPVEERQEAEGSSADTLEESRGEAEGSETGAQQD